MPTPTIARTRDELTAAIKGADAVALVPTMGALHDGHQELMQFARGLSNCLVASVFVNPTQFAAGEDLDAYPRTFGDDLQRCSQAGVDVVFAPDVATMYPDGSTNTVTVDPGPLGAILEGAERPTHFRGVLTVVAKLFGLVRPDLAVFGEKDYQQLVLIRQMVRELAMGVEVVGCPTVREHDGLARSSRNVYLHGDERLRATALYRALQAGAEAAADGPDAVVTAARAVLAAEEIVPDYVALTDSDLGSPEPGKQARLLIAARVGKPRLLDNMSVDLGRQPANIGNEGA